MNNINAFCTPTDDVKNDSRQQQKRLKDLKQEYEEIEQRCKTKIIDDLAGLYYKDDPVRSSKELVQKKKVIKSRSINIEILEDGSVKTSKVIRSKADPNNVELEEDESLGKSISISISGRSSRKSQHSRKKSDNMVLKKKSIEEKPAKHVSDDDDDECDTLNAVDNISVHDDLEESNSLLHQENVDIRNQNEDLKKKYKKHKNYVKTLKSKLEKSTGETAAFKRDIEKLKGDLGRLLQENTELRLQQSAASERGDRRLQRQDSMFEAPVRDSQDQATQVEVRAGADKDRSNFSSFEVDYFTEVIIDELKKEIRELKNQVKQAPESSTGVGVNFKAKEDTILSQISKMKIASENLKKEASKSQEENSNSTEIEKLKIEVESLRKMLIQEQETSATFESYIGLLKASYTNMFGPLESQTSK